MFYFKRKILPVILAAIFISVFASCSSDLPISDGLTVSTGNYYLNGDKDNACIQIINDNTMRFINFDIEYLAYYLVAEGTDYTGKEIEDFMKRHNLPDVFNEAIEFEFNETESIIYVKALSNSNEPNEAFLTVNYRMKYEDKNTISFMESIYIRRDISQSM